MSIRIHLPHVAWGVALFFVVGCTAPTPKTAPTSSATGSAHSRRSDGGGSPEIATPPSVDGSSAFGLSVSRKYSAYGHAEFRRILEQISTGVTITTLEKSPDTGVWHRWTADASTSYEPLAVCSRHANEFYVVGRNADTSLVLEKWDLEPWPTGAFSTERVSVSSPLGVPASPQRTAVRYQGPFVEPPSRSTPILNRSGLGAVTLQGLEAVEAEVDPEGRFVVVRAVDGNTRSSLIRVELASGSEEVLGDWQTIPELAGAETMNFLHSTELGRLLCVRTEAPYDVFLRDAQDDGQFEGAMLLTAGTEEMNTLPSATLTDYP